MAEIPKAVGKIALVAGAFEAKCGAEVGQCRFAHLFAVFTSISTLVDEHKYRKWLGETHIAMPSSPTT